MPQIPDGFNSKQLALDYLDRHLYQRFIFPVARGAKFPPCLDDNLETNCSNDPKRIAKWAKDYPGCNWAVAHRKSKLLVADVDTNRAKGKTGDETYALLELTNGWPDTERTTTPSGGWHMIYEGWSNEDHPEHIMALGENGIGKDIDSPNYSVIAGCVLADGTSYTTNDAPAVECPSWIYDTIKNSKTKSRITDAGEIVVELDQAPNVAWAIDFLRDDAPPAIEKQAGDWTTYKVACHLKDNGISPALAVDLLVEHYNPRCVPEWDRDDLEKKVGNAFNYANLSKTGGRTAEADFADDNPGPITVMNPDKVAAQAKTRAENTEAGIKKPPQYQRKPVIFSMFNLTNSLHDAVMAIRADKVHDHVFRRGPMLVRLNQAVTPRDLEVKKVKRKRGSLMITPIASDYMLLRLDQAGEFHVKAKPKKKPGPKPKEKADADI